ncbi:L-dopachrome tautomerase-related protein [Candidatus Nitrosocosmicus franklandus]|uniref:Major royal jelly protein n=1 Tax=Candidatus Nitrosocosmicus franklandianus TaxID=1798806 RepID=A0A484IBG3_9ARCH|nr:L-dopachrome tautomerase-related protein [Candidatus Nitrosocosmicus franklandus]VFJ13567.1 Major royal jelly protein [Candidatus Nitrosocosmicus franklandus]
MSKNFEKSGISRDIPSVELPSSESLGALEPVAFFNDAMPTGVTVSHTGRIFVNFPKWGDDVKFTVSEIVDGRPIAYPNESINEVDQEDQASKLVSVQSVVVDPVDRLWILDTGSPLFKPTEYGGPKLICVNLDTNKVTKKILFPQTIAQPTTYLNDIRFDLRRGNDGMAFITDSSMEGSNAIIVVDLHTGECWRRLNEHPSTKPEDLGTFLPLVEGRPFLERQPDGTVKQGASMGADGIAINSDGSRLYYCPLGSRKLYSVAIDALVDRNISEEEVANTVQNHGDRGGASDGLESDAEGNIYSTNYEHNAILRLRYSDNLWETLVYDPRLLWPDTLSLANDGYLYVTANQLHRQGRYNKGKDIRVKPYTLFRIRVNAQPVMLK